MTAAAMSLVAYSGDPQVGKSGYSRYLAHVSEITALAAGKMTHSAIHRYRNAGKSPNASKIYAYMPPDLVITVPSSAKHSAPTRHITPHSVQIIRDSPTDPDSINTPFGETNIPLPTMVPRIKAHPLKSPSVRFSLTVSEGVEELVSLCTLLWWLLLLLLLSTGSDAILLLLDDVRPGMLLLLLLPSGNMTGSCRNRNEIKEINYDALMFL